MMGIDPEILDQEEEKAKNYKTFMEMSETQFKASIRERWTKWLSRYEKRLFFETLSCKSAEESKESQDFKVKIHFESVEQLKEYRVKQMNQTNPLYILRNYMAEEAIQLAEKGDYSGVNNLLELLLNPFTPQENNVGSEYKKCPPPWASEICVSCSS